MANSNDPPIYQQRPGVAKRDNRYGLLYISIMVASLGGFIIGYDTALISGALIFVRDYFQLSDHEIELLVSSVVLFAAIGALLAWPLCQVLGRKKAMISSCLFLVAGTLAVVRAPFFPVVILGRSIVGLGVGIASMSTLIYLAEIVPPNIRGSSVCLINFFYNLGIFCALLVSLFFADTKAWRWIIASSLIPSLSFFLLLFKIPESPFWFLKKGKREEAQKALHHLRRNYDVHSEMELIDEVIEEEQKREGKFWSSGVIKALLIGLVIACLMELTGIDAIFYYAPYILKKSGGESTHQAILSGLIFSTSSMVFSFITILFIDIWGRRKLLLSGLAIMVVGLVVLGAFFSSFFEFPHNAGLFILTFIVYGAGFALGIGTVGWLLISEIFPFKIRAFAISLCCCVNWVANFLISQTFLGSTEVFGLARTFWFYALMCSLGWVFAFFLIPETSGKSLETIEEFWLQAKKHGTDIEL